MFKGSMPVQMIARINRPTVWIRACDRTGLSCPDGFIFMLMLPIRL